VDGLNALWQELVTAKLIVYTHKALA